MASGLLLSEAIAEPLRKPYHKGDLDITVQYLIEELKVGAYRVLIKSNFDTACWIPPAGKRSSSSIYYGDRMLDRVFDHFCKVESVPIPPTKEFMEKVKARLEAEAEAKTMVAAAGKKSSEKSPRPIPPMTQVLNDRVAWLKANLNADQWARLVAMLSASVKSYGRHERQHARHTPQDLKRVTKDLKLLKIPFQFFNLFEDARIEHLSREELAGEKFGWLDIEDIAPANNPCNMFLRCIQLEGEQDAEALASTDSFGSGSRTVGDAAEMVDHFYRRAIACVTAEHLYPVIREFIDEFKEDLPPPPDDGEGDGEGEGAGEKGKKGKKGAGAAGESEDGEGGEDGGDDGSGAEERAGDLSTAAEAAEKGDEFFDEFDADAEVVGGTDAEGKDAEEKAKGRLKADGKTPPPSGKGNKAQGIPESIEPQASGGRSKEHHFLANKPGKIDDAYKKRVDQLTSMLMRMFKTHCLPMATETEGARISSRHLARGEFKFIHKRVFGGKGKRKFSIIYDCSGSMNGRPDREGKLFLLAMNNIARRGFLEGTLVLSGWVDNKPGWLSYPFPVNDEVIMRIHPSHGSEGLQDALKDNLVAIKGMDDVFVYTDANICDAPLDRDFFASRKIWPVGLYVGEEGNASEMERHFPQNIIKRTIEEVVETMLTRNRRTVS